MKSKFRTKVFPCFLALIFATTITTGCKPDEQTIIPEEIDLSVSYVELHDIDNNDNASDFKVTFTKSKDEEFISEYRVFFLNDNTITFDIEQAESVIEGNYVSFSKGGYVYFDETTRSIDGEVVSADNTYVVYILSVAKDEENNSSLSESSNALKLNNQITVETLRYAGSSNTEGVSVDSQGDVYVSDLGLTGVLGNFNGKEVFKITKDRNFSIFNNSLSAPLGHAFDSNNKLYVANYNKSEITQISTDGVASTYLSDARLTGGDITFDNDGNLYATVIKSNTVYKINSSNEIVEISTGGSLKSPVGIAVDNNNNIYAANFGDGKITKITPEGAQSILATIPSQVGYICFANNKIYATGYSSNIIYGVTLQGSISTLIGTGTKTTKDGGFNEASFDNPNGISVTQDGKYLFISQSNGSLRKISLPQ